MMEELFGDVISSYSRAQAIEDGVLVDVSKMASEAGFRIPVAVSAAVWADINQKPASQDVNGRLWDILWMTRLRARGNAGDTIYTDLIMQVGRNKRYRVKAVVGPGDALEPVITIMRPEED